MGDLLAEQARDRLRALVRRLREDRLELEQTRAFSAEERARGLEALDRTIAAAEEALRRFERALDRPRHIGNEA